MAAGVIPRLPRGSARPRPCPLTRHDLWQRDGQALWRLPLLLAAAVTLSACGQPPDSMDAVLTVSLDGKPVASRNVSLRCSYAWAYFSERDMASHYEARAEPARAPRIFVTLPDQRLLSLVPEPWPPLGDSGRCTLTALQGWQALVLDAHKPVPVLSHITSEDADGRHSGLAVLAHAAQGAAPADQDGAASRAIRQAVEKASSLDYVVIDVPVAGAGETAMSADNSTVLSGESVSALWALPGNRPSVLKPAIRADGPLDPDLPRSGDALAGLPDFDLAKVMAANAFSTYPSMPGLPITIDPNRPSGTDKVYFASDVPTPSVTLPGLEDPLPVAPVVAVWYPVYRKLIVLAWTRRAAALARRLDGT